MLDLLEQVLYNLKKMDILGSIRRDLEEKEKHGYIVLPVS
jgi:hypothetical protein